MKITKKRIQEIIKEELEIAEAAQQPAPDQEEAIKTKQQLALKFKELSKLIPKAQGIDSVEAKLINAIVDKIIGDSNNESAKNELIIVLKKLGVEL